MDLGTAIATARALIGALADEIDAHQWAMSAVASRLPDTARRLPGDDGYIDTYDPHWLAAEILEAYAITRALEGDIAEFDSEGARFRLTAPDLHGAAARLREKSIIGRVAARRHVLEVIGRAADYHPTSGRRPTLAMLPNGALIPRDLDWT